MAKKNKLGTPYLGLELEKEEEKKLKEILKARDISAKQLQRTLLRKYIKEYEEEKAKQK